MNTNENMPDYGYDDVMIIIYHPDGKRFGFCGPDEIVLLEKLLQDAQQRRAIKTAEEERRYKIIYIEEGDRIDRGFDPDILPPLKNVPEDVIVVKRWFSDRRRAVGF